MDRQKIIKGLDLCSNALYCADPSSRCDQCTYKTKDMTGTDEINCSDVLMSDALAILKESVPQGVVDQMRWERDTALSQLKEIGKGLGEKMDDIVDLLKGQEEKPLRCDKCCYHREDGWCAMQEQWVTETDYCSFGAWEGR